MTPGDPNLTPTTSGLVSPVPAPDASNAPARFQAVGEVLRHPDRLDSSLCPGVPGPLLARLRADVVRCVHADCCYSPLSDVAKQVW
jgi:hypothetical protein